MNSEKVLFRIPDKNGCTNMGGIAIDNSNNILYGIKSNTNNDKQYLFVIKNYKNPNINKSGFVTPTYEYNLTTLGHANGMTLSGGYLFVACDSNYTAKISTKDLLKGKTKVKPGTTYTLPISYINTKSYKNAIATGKLPTFNDLNDINYTTSSIASVANNNFILHFSGQNDKNNGIRVYFTSKLSSYTKYDEKTKENKALPFLEYNIANKKEFKLPKDFYKKAGNYIAQDIFYKNGYIYIIITEKEEKGDYNISHILKYHYNSKKYIGMYSFDKGGAIKYEIESMHIDNNNLIFSANERYIKTFLINKKNVTKKVDMDGIHVFENWELASLVK